MTPAPTAEELLQLMSAPSYENTYVLGCLARRVTFYSQQCRAFNLIWSLFTTGKLREGMSVGIVGGGLAGITAAAAASLKGCKVTLLESGERVLHLQRQTTTRSVYPFIYTWPTEGSDSHETDLPCLNWQGGTTQIVVDQLLDQWHKFVTDDSISVRTEFEVKRILNIDGKPRISGNKKGEGGFDTLDFDCVILAVGFGTERYIGLGGTKSYWQIDAYHQADIGQQGIKTVLVSGCGDGGLIDVVRFRLTDFNHSLLLSDFEKGGVNAIARQLLAIEEDARSFSGRDVSAYLYDEYKKLEIPVALTTALKSRLRKDTRVTLNGKATSPLTLDASILNRLAVFLLMQYGGVNYLHGEWDPKLDTADTGYLVTLKAPNGEIERHAFDEVILRHGPAPLIGKLLPSADTSRLKQLSLTESDRTMHRAWPTTFYPTTDSCKRANPVTLLGKELAWAISKPGTQASLIHVMIPADVPSLAGSTLSGDSTSFTLPPTSAPTIANDEKAGQFETEIVKNIQIRQFDLAASLSKEALEWLASNESSIHESGVRALYFAIAKETLNRSLREGDPAIAVELKALARVYHSKAKGPQ